MTVTLKHTLTGIVAEYPDEYLDHPVWGSVLVPTHEEAFCTDCEIPDQTLVSEPEPDPEIQPEIERSGNIEFTVEATPRKSRRG